MRAYYSGTMGNGIPRENALKSSPSFLLWQLNNKWQRQQKAALKSFGLTYVEFIILAILIKDMKFQAAHQKYIIRRSKTDKTMTSQVLRSLERKRLIFRRKGVIDGRAVSIRVRSRGMNLFKLAEKTVEDIDKNCLRELQNGELAKLLQ